MSSNNATSIHISCYTPISERLTVPLTNWEKSVVDYILLHGVRFVKGTTRTAEGQERAKAQRLNATEGPKPRTRYIDYVFKTYYSCHRSGEKRQAKTEQNNSSEGSRKLQKKSKKIECTANLVATCYKSDPNNVVLHHTGNHNHQIGGLEDLKFLPLSQVAKQLIEQRLREGFKKRDTRISIQNHFLHYSQANLNTDVEQSLGNEAQVIVHRDQMVHSTEIYSIYKKIQKAFYKKADDQKESVKLWLTELKENEGYDTFLADNFDSTFSFGFVSPWQKALLIESESESVCLDVTHCTSNIDKGILYTIVTRHPWTGTGCPVAFFFTTDHSMLPVKHFLYFLRYTVHFSSLKKITIDISTAERNAINSVYPEVVIQWCIFRVARAWMGKIREYIKLGSSAANARVHRAIITNFKRMMWEKDTSVFLPMLSEFVITYAAYPDFIQYFKRQYLENDAFMRWSVAFQPQVFTSMETNNYKVLNIGKMSPEERRRRACEMSAEDANVATLVTMIEELEEQTGYKVRSFSNEEVYYIIQVEQDSIKSCGCKDFRWNRISCKHMYLLKRLHRDLATFEPVVYDGIRMARAEETANEEPVLEPSTVFDFSDLIATLSMYQHNPRNLNEQQLESIKSHVDGISLLLQNDDRLPSNINLQTQRR
ncbi:hypothetical protein HPULCUR_008916 [Helicostylum pulchrum]|uniref:SWIM-type domain-containing protein n=1 Tax=Helicostylum pulchrum TaxID=562976 RepID=A0ABP9Y8Y6_9FUNG